MSAVSHPGFAPLHALERALHDIKGERLRQRLVEGYADTHDDAQTDGEIARAAGCYAIGNADLVDGDGMVWPWAGHHWKPKSPRENLVKAAALIIAEIERIDRLPPSTAGGDA